MSKFYKIGPAGLPVGIGSKGAELPIGIGSKGNTVQVPEDGNPLYSPAIKDLKRDSLTTEKRSVEERIAVLKEEIKRQRNLKDAEDSPLMEIALHRFKAYGDPSGLNEIANRRQTSDMAKLQKDEADAAAMKANENKLEETKILAQNAKAVLDDARDQHGTDSPEYKNAVRDYRLPRLNVIKAAEATGDKKLIEEYKATFPEVGKLSTTSPEETGVESGDAKEESGGAKKDNVIIADEYRLIAKDPKKSAHDIAEELVGKGKIKNMSSKDWVPLKNELNDNINARYKAEVNAYKAYKSKLGIYDLFEKRKGALETYNKTKTRANRDVIRLIDDDLKKLGVKVADYANKGYPKPKVVKKPEEPKKYLE